MIFLAALADTLKKKSIFPFSVKSLLNVAILTWIVANTLGALTSTIMGPDQLHDLLSLRWVFSLYACVYAGSRVNLSEKYLKYLFFGFSLLVGISLFTSERYEGYRIQGFYGNPNVFALAIAVPWAFILSLVCTVQLKKSAENIALFSALAIASIGIFMSYTRGVWIAAAACILIVAAFKKSKKVFYLIAAGGASLLFIFFLNLFQFQDRIKYSLDLTKGSSQSLRFTAWKVATQVFIDHPWFGTGFYESYRIFPEYYKKMGVGDQLILVHTHNQYLQTLSDSGIIGFIAFAMFFILSLRYFVKSYQNNESTTQAIALGGVLTISIFLISSLTESPLMINEPRSFLILLAGASYGYLRSKEAQRILN